MDVDRNEHGRANKLQTSLEDEVFVTDTQTSDGVQHRMKQKAMLRKQASFDLAVENPELSEDNFATGMSSSCQTRSKEALPVEIIRVPQKEIERDSVISNQSVSSELMETSGIVGSEKRQSTVSRDSGFSISSFASRPSISSDTHPRSSSGWRENKPHFTSQDSTTEECNDSEDTFAVPVIQASNSLKGKRSLKRSSGSFQKAWPSVGSQDSISSQVGHLDLDENEGNVCIMKLWMKMKV